MDGRWSGRLQVEVEASSPRRQLVNRPHPRTLGICLMPGPRLEDVELRDEHIHVGIELDQKTARVVVIGSEVVARGVPRRSPEDRMALRRKKIGHVVMRGAAAQLEGEMVKTNFRRTDNIEDVVIVIAGQERRYPLEPIGRAEPDGRTEFHEFICLRRYQGDVSKTRWNNA